MLRKLVVMVVVAAMAMSTSLVWAGQGQRQQAKKQVAAGTCVRQQTPGQCQYRTADRTGPRHKYGPGDGTGLKGDGPKDGTGYGKKAGDCNGTGTCDGTGPHGTAAKKQTKRPR